MAKRIPAHVTIIMDGNGRWAESRGKERIFGHKEGIERVRDCVEFASQQGIRYLSVYAFSTENWSRPAAEVRGLMELMAAAMLQEIPKLLENDVRFRVVGDRASLSPALVAQIEAAESRTAGCRGLNLVIMLSYSGKWDIMQASKAWAQDGCPEGGIAPYLATAGIPDPDLLVRTGGEQRISNYMLWQCAYSEFYFTPTLWPDFRKCDFQAALDSYAERERRFGLTGGQISELKENE